MNFLNLLFPSRCPFCSVLIEPKKEACDECLKYTQIAPHLQVLSNGCFCVSAFRHEGVWRKAVLKYKYKSNRQYYAQFAIILRNIISKKYDKNHFDLYTSVPIHRKKLNTRGFDQVKLIAKETANLNKAKYKPLLIQTKMNKAQHMLSGDERFNNVKDIYRCKNSNAVKDKNILLFDDIITTGSTLTECSKILLEAGARSVCCVTINW